MAAQTLALFSGYSELCVGSVPGRRAFVNFRVVRVPGVFRRSTRTNLTMNDQSGLKTLRPTGKAFSGDVKDEVSVEVQWRRLRLTSTGLNLTILGEYAATLRHLRLAKLLCPEVESGIIGAIAWFHGMAGKRGLAVRLL